MKNRFIICLLTCVCGAGCTNAYAQKWLKNLGKVLDKVVEASSGTEKTENTSGNNTTTSSSPTASTSTPQTPNANQRNVIHSTPSTISITVPEFSYDSFYGRYSEGYVVIKDKNTNKIGIYNVKGEPQIPYFIFDEAGTRKIPWFDNGVIPVLSSNNGKRLGCIVNTKGKTVATFPTVTQFGNNFYDGMLTMFRYIKTGNKNILCLRYVDPSGKDIYPALWQDLSNVSFPNLQEARPFCDGLSCYYDYKKKLYGYFDRQGKIVIPAQFTSAEDFSEGRAVVSLDNKSWFFIDKTGKQCIELTFNVKKPESFHDGYAIVYKRGDSNDYFCPGEKKCYMNTSGEIKSKPLNKALSFTGGYAIIEMCNNGETRTCVIDKDINIIKNVTVDYIDKASVLHDMQRIQDGGRLLAPDGTPIFQKDDSEAYTDLVVKKFHGGVAHFYADKYKGYINEKGEILLQFVISDF